MALRLENEAGTVVMKGVFHEVRFWLNELAE
jgi:hypothetical protein